MTRAVTQPLLYSATGLPEGARYFGFVVSSRPPALAEPTSTGPSGRAVVCVADLIGEPRMFGGRRWHPILNVPAEVLELIDAATGQLVTVVRAAFLPEQSSSSAPREPAGGLSPSGSVNVDAHTEEPEGERGASLSALRRHEPGSRRNYGHRKGRSSVAIRQPTRVSTGGPARLVPKEKRP